MNRFVTTAALILTTLGVGPLPRADHGGEWVYPIGPPNGPVHVIHPFAPPGQPWYSGHRGVDVAGSLGSEVRSVSAGHVTYAGFLAGRGVVAIDHDARRVTYEPVVPSVNVGDVVRAGEPIGTLALAGSHCAPSPCLHWGMRRGHRYVDPLGPLRPNTIHLLPLAERAVSGAAPAPPQLHSHRLQWPVAEPTVSSPFGMRVHPITGVYKLHDGTDFAAACGVPVLASADGFVRQVGQRGAYGLQVTVDHGVVGDDQVTTSYSHLSAIAVTAGQKVTVGQPIGRVGTTGSSTGCHLHFMVYADGVVTDPMNWLPAQRRQQHRRETRSHPDQLDRPDKVGGQRSGPRMRLSIRQAQSVDRHVGIDLRGS